MNVVLLIMISSSVRFVNSSFESKLHTCASQRSSFASSRSHSLLRFPFLKLYPFSSGLVQLNRTALLDKVASQAPGRMLDWTESYSLWLVPRGSALGLVEAVVNACFVVDPALGRFVP